MSASLCSSCVRGFQWARVYSSLCRLLFDLFLLFFDSFRFGFRFMWIGPKSLSRSSKCVRVWGASFRAWLETGHVLKFHDFLNLHILRFVVYYSKYLLKIIINLDVLISWTLRYWTPNEKIDTKNSHCWLTTVFWLLVLEAGSKLCVYNFNTATIHSSVFLRSPWQMEDIFKRVGEGLPTPKLGAATYYFGQLPPKKNLDSFRKPPPPLLYLAPLANVLGNSCGVYGSTITYRISYKIFTGFFWNPVNFL